MALAVPMAVLSNSLTTRMAMNRVSLGDLDTARVDIKRTHEREAVIAAIGRAAMLAYTHGQGKNGVGQ